jgi:hypothetical protein
LGDGEVSELPLLTVMQRRKIATLMAHPDHETVMRRLGFPPASPDVSQAEHAESHRFMLMAVASGLMHVVLDYATQAMAVRWAIEVGDEDHNPGESWATDPDGIALHTVLVQTLLGFFYAMLRDDGTFAIPLRREQLESDDEEVSEGEAS